MKRNWVPRGRPNFASRRNDCTICAMIRRVLASLLFLVPAIAIPAHACTCSDAPPGKCPGLQKDDVVFLGTVTAVEDIAYAAPRPSDSPGLASESSAKGTAPVDIVASRLTRYHFRIDERFALA